MRQDGIKVNSKVGYKLEMDKKYADVAAHFSIVYCNISGSRYKNKKLPDFRRKKENLVHLSFSS